MGCQRALFDSEGEVVENQVERSSEGCPSMRTRCASMDPQCYHNTDRTPVREPGGLPHGEVGGSESIDVALAKVQDMMMGGSGTSEVVQEVSVGYLTPAIVSAGLNGGMEGISYNSGETSCMYVLEPPETVTAPEIVSPDIEIRDTHNESLDPACIPTKGMSFKTEAEATEFYHNYAVMAGFHINMGNKKTFSRVMRCGCQGKGEYYKGDEDLRVRNNTSKKTGCKSQLKFRRTYDSDGNELEMVIEHANLIHNHKLMPSPSKVKQMSGNKSKEPMLFEIVDDLQVADASTQCIKNVLEDMHGGPENVPITSRDIENRKAANVRAEHADDINKLIEFFKDCEQQNPQFRWVPKLDSDGFIHSLFWSHASMQADYVDIGDVVSFDTTYKTNIYDKPLAMFVGYQTKSYL